MSVTLDPHGPSLVSIPANPVPDGARVGYFLTEDRVRLRYARWPRRPGPHRGTVCLVHGRTEYIEKYFETIEDFRARGFVVATFDWRGQGGSDRLIADARLGYVATFEDYWCDLKSFHAEILLPDCPPPFYLVGHSMGGLVALDAAVRERMMFERVFLSAPMLGLDRLALSMRGMARLAGILNFLGLGEMPVARKADKPPSEQTFPDNPLTSDLKRYLRAVAIAAERPEIEIGVPTVSWAGAAMRAMAEAGEDRFGARLRVPVLMLAAPGDRVVSSAAIERLGLSLRTGRHMVIPGARHELFMDTDAVRGQVLAAFDAFITEQSA